VNALADPLHEPSGLPDSPNESHDATLNEPEDPLGKTPNDNNKTSK